MQKQVAMPLWRRPIRIPEDIEITHADPAYATAGERGQWRVPFRLSKDVAAGSKLKVQLWGGRNNRIVFEQPQTDDPGADAYIAAELGDGTRLTLREDDTRKKPGTYVLEGWNAAGLKAGDTLVVILGDKSGGGGGSKASTQHGKDKFFVLYSVPSDDAEQKLPNWTGGNIWNSETARYMVAACTMHVLGAEPAVLRAYAPAQCRPGEEVAITIRPEDKYGNAAAESVKSVDVLLEGEQLPVRIERIEDCTALRAHVKLAVAGTHRLVVREPESGMEVVTNPVLCREADVGQDIYWGMIHGHTEMSDGTGSLETYFHQLRHEVGLDFCAPGDHDHLFETPDELWKVTCEAVKRWNVPGEFVTFPGYEWAKWRQNGDGDRNVYFPVDDRPMYRSDDSEYPAPPDLFRVLKEKGEKAIVIPHHPGHRGNFCDYKDHGPEFERLVEIFQTRGGYECSEEDGNPVPERKVMGGPYVDGFVRRALALGWRIGFTAGGDDHSGHWGTEFLFGGSAGAYKQGLMSVEAEARTREAIWDALYERRVVATTGTRMLLHYELDGSPMGSELRVADQPGLAGKRALFVEFHGTGELDRIDIIRNNKEVHTVPGDGTKDLSFTWEDTDPIDEIRMPAAKFCDHPFTFYYVRAVQKDNEVAWASPVWIDP